MQKKKKKKKGNIHYVDNIGALYAVIQTIMRRVERSMYTLILNKLIF
jgi:hypothetical protein